MAEIVDSLKYPSLPSNYVTIAHLQERWLKEKQRKQQQQEEEEEYQENKQYPVAQSHQNRIVVGGRIRESEGKEQYPVAQNRRNRIVNGKSCSAKSWREVGLIAKESKLKEVNKGYFGKRKVGKEEMVDVENGGRESYKGKCKEVEEVVASVCAVEVVGGSNVDRGIEGQKRSVGGFRGRKHSGRRMGDGVGEVSEKGDSVEQCGYGDKEVAASVCAVEVVGESNVDRGITGQKCGVGFRGKTNSRGRMGDGAGQVSDKMNSVEQSGKQYNAEKEEVSVDMKERTNEKVVGESNVDREMVGQRCGVGFRGKKNIMRKMGDRVGEMTEKGDSVEQSGQERNGEKEVVSVDVQERINEKVGTRGAFGAYGDKDVASVCTVEVVGENEVDREIVGQKCRVGFRGKKNSRRRMVDGQVSYKIDSGEQSGKQYNAEEEECSVDVKERTNQKVKVSGAFRAYGDDEVEEVATVCMVEVVGENKADREITGQKGRVGFRGKKHGWRKFSDRVGEVSDKANSAKKSGQECNAEKEKVSFDVKERTDEKVRVEGTFCAYGDKSIDVPLIDSGAGLKMMIQRDLGDLSLTDRRYGHGRSAIRVYGDKWRYGSSRKNEPRKMLNQRENNLVWIKKGESSNGNVAEIETQVDVSSQSTSRS